MLDRFAVRIVPASHISDLVVLDEETNTIEIAADARPEILPIVAREVARFTPFLSQVPIVAVAK